MKKDKMPNEILYSSLGESLKELEYEKLDKEIKLADEKLNEKIELLDDFNEIEECFSSFDIDFPSMEEIEETIEVASLYMEKKTNIKEEILKRIKFEIKYCNLGYVFLAACLIVIGALVLGNKENYKTIEISVASIPFVLFITHIFKNQNTTMIELEKSLKYNFTQLFISKLYMILAISTVINVFFSIGLLCIDNSLDGFRVFANWITPLNLVCAVTFVAAHRLGEKEGYVSAIVIATMIALGKNSSVMIMEQLAYYKIVVINVMFIFFIVYSVKKYLQNEISAKKSESFS